MNVDSVSKHETSLIRARYSQGYPSDMRFESTFSCVGPHSYLTRHQKGLVNGTPMFICCVVVTTPTGRRWADKSRLFSFEDVSREAYV
jgi:hypothetical protein